LKAWELDRQRSAAQRAREQVGARLWLRFSTSFAPALAADDVGCRLGRSAEVCSRKDDGYGSPRLCRSPLHAGKAGLHERVTRSEGTRLLL
jgi:hypothetical protein